MNFKIRKNFAMVLSFVLSFSVIGLPGCENSKDAKIAELESQLVELEDQLAESENQVVSLQLELSEKESSEEQSEDYDLTGEEVLEIILDITGYPEDSSDDFMLGQNISRDWVVDNNNVGYQVMTKLDGEILKLTFVSRMTRRLEGIYVYDLVLKEFISQERGGTAQEDLSNFPYAVPIDIINNATFYFNKLNNPTSISISFNENNEGTVEFLIVHPNPEKRKERVVFEAKAQNIESKEIEVFNSERFSYEDITRKVHVNTEIVLLNVDQEYFNGNLYLFYNNAGGISLATPNYAGNVLYYPDVMQELTL